MTMDYKIHLSKDPKLRKLLSDDYEIKLTKRKNIGLWLCRSIMGQQLSVKVASIIYQRFINLAGTSNPSMELIAALQFDKLRSIGLSNSKTEYIQNVARFFIEEKLRDATLHQMTDEEIKSYLGSIKGVGPWTVEMLLMFAMARPDVFSLHDYGLQSAMTKIYKLDPTNKKDFKDKLQSISLRWSPVRTYGCMLLWHYKDSTKKQK